MYVPGKDDVMGSRVLVPPDGDYIAEVMGCGADEGGLFGDRLHFTLAIKKEGNPTIIKDYWMDYYTATEYGSSEKANLDKLYLAIFGDNFIEEFEGKEITRDDLIGKKCRVVVGKPKNGRYSKILDIEPVSTDGE